MDSTLNGKYRLIRRIGEGSMGEVFEAEHLTLGTRVALKLLHAHLARRAGFVERVVREAQAVARIDHPNVVRVFDVERTERGAYMVMELVRGRPLDEYLADRTKARRPLGLSEAIRLMTQVLDGVAAAHHAGVTHRDLKPANILVTEDRSGAQCVKVLDFGIAKIRDDEAYRTLTAPGTILGTPGYMAPEQAFGNHPVDARADVFCLGVVFYELLSGRHPAAGVEPIAIPHFMATKRHRPLVELAPGIPRLAAAVERALEPEPANRFADAAAFREAVAGAEREQALLPRAPLPRTIPASPSPVAPEPSRDERAGGASPSTAPTALDTVTLRRQTIASVVGAVIAALALGLFVRETAGRFDDSPPRLASLAWPEAPAAPSAVTTSGAAALPALWPGGRTRVEGDADGAHLEITHGRHRDAGGRVLLALSASTKTQGGPRVLPLEAATLDFQYYRTHRGPRRTFAEIPASPLVVEMPLASDGKYHLAVTLEAEGRTLRFLCDLCLGPDGRRCPAMRRSCQPAPP